jgi:hypothetical protein
MAELFRRMIGAPYLFFFKALVSAEAYLFELVEIESLGNECPESQSRRCEPVEGRK